MYEQYWGLTEKPFENTTDSRFYYPSESHQAAILKLRYVVENHRECAILTGASGLGKSLVVQTLFRNIPEPISPRVNLVYPQMPSDQLLAFLAHQFTEEGADGRQPSVEDSVRRIQSFLHKNQAEGKQALVVVDEAHLIGDGRTLDTLRLLLNFHAEFTNVLTLLFVGQPSLLPLLDRHRDLEERLAVKCLLRPLDADESIAYVEHRLNVAGATRPIFNDDAYDAIHELARGIPRQINRLADLALLVGFAEEHSKVDGDAIRAVSDELVTVVPE